MNKTVTVGSRTLRGPGIPNENGQVIYSNTIPDRLSCMTQLSKADSPSSTEPWRPRIETFENGISFASPKQKLSTGRLGDSKLKNMRSQVQQTQELRQTLIPLSKRVRKRSQSSSPTPQDAGPSAKHNHPSRADIRRGDKQPPRKQKSQW
ncbi:hypothetical protein CRG98_032033 [Punica granatum]|uniref:Uncharacterized protein n=1 Tax=Punica granatum TaxID=22663 RepID=A0A2I0IU93_PUNGR|nr:hypothetical protein CRG98_032033 [Punica granatum]